MSVEYLTPAIEDRAVEVLTLLADRGQHRAPSIPDLLIAATAELAGLTVLHYNAFALSSHLSGLTCRESKSGKMPRAARGLPRMSVAGSKRRPAAKRRHVAAGLPVSRFWLPPGP